jgi:tRNA-splicing ligase RtcB
MLSKLKTLIPMEMIELSAQEQIYKELARPFLKKLAIMPDVHMGYTLPIGGVALLNNVISPEYVGYDIGCGMCCVVTDIDAHWLLKGIEKTIFDKIYRDIPVGFNCGDKKPYNAFVSASGDQNLNDKVNARLNIQLGTLGSGNHFIEIGKNTEGKLAITIHSGSRNIGHSVASYYMKLSKRPPSVHKVKTIKFIVNHDPSVKVNEQFSTLPAGFFWVHSPEGQEYLQDMNFCLQYALDNRKEMMKSVLRILGLCPERHGAHDYIQNMINENHNHAVITPGGILHRKGATPADEGQLGVIPGNMKSGVYITRGLGNEEYLSSASHGAGRKMGRNQAKENINLDDFEETMKGIMAKVDRSTLDEAPMAYKNLHDVIDAQKGIVIDIVDHIEPLINIKG